ncbi:type VI secretion system-associated FHA domain protein TagH [Rhodobacterales bacterium]|nr:type VI secretion system-associated FHA domain protein TagH [Rhodobacterales bacterium]
MRITLQIENVDRLETGGQVSYSCADRGFDIGRHEHLDWSLPDPQRVISGKHCEVRFEGGQFVLYDISTNGTFLNGSPNRMDRAHALRSGDRLMIGDYIISVALDSGEGMSAGPVQPAQQTSSQPWETPQSSAPSYPDSGWPGSASPPPQQAPYPMPEGDNPWASSSGMEGRHAPPSSAPGIGTPADDIWSRQEHGWGNADPSLYDPQMNEPQRSSSRPAQADPLDHLATQPELQRSGPASQPAAFEPPASSAETPFPPLHDGPGSAPAEKPLFGMPDLGDNSTEPALEGDGNAGGGMPTAADSFPADGIWAQPTSGEPAGKPATPDVPEPDEPPLAAPMPSGGMTPEPVAETIPSSNAAAATPAVAAERGSSELLQAFAEGAGIPVSVLAGRDPVEFARELGTLLQGMTGDMMGLLQARSQVKAMTRNANRTLISRSGNNALKFSPTPQMALQTMLSSAAEENGYLPMSQAMKSAFRDIQKHHVWTYAAMQKAAARFEETLSPDAMEADTTVTKSTFGNPKAKLWEKLQERWSSLSGAYDDGIVGLFTQYFTESYEDLTGDDEDQPARSN